MKPIGIQRIERRLDRFDGLIDMTDWDGRPKEQCRAAFLSRAVAAYAVMILGNASEEASGKSITDSFHDRGIDAIYFDARLSQLIVVQSKWSDCLAWKEAGEFVDGVKRLIAPNWASFSNNQKIRARRREIDLALMSSAKILLVTAHKGAVRGDDQSLRRVDELASEIDGGSGLSKVVHWHQKDLLDAIQAESSPASIVASLTLSNWGETKDPYHAVYGRVQAIAIAQLWNDNPHLTHMNIREYASHGTDVNAAIAKTIAEAPQHFWYFNNGLTVICDSIKPAVMGRLNPSVAVFTFEGIRLVNGAQTTGIIGEKLKTLAEQDRDKLWVQLRAIAVGNCPDGFATQITKFTNLQNAVSRQDFVAMDPLQSRLAIDFAVEKRRYAFKWGTDPDPSGDRGCTLKEATVALACADPDTRLAVQAKREISQLWDTESESYRKLFHKDLTAQRVWNAVRIMRAVDSAVAGMGSEEQESIGVHLKLVILHLVFNSPQLVQWDTANDPANTIPKATDVAGDVFVRVCEYLGAMHQGEYLASLSKNFEKCDAMIRALRNISKQGNLFADQR